MYMMYKYKQIVIQNFICFYQFLLIYRGQLENKKIIIFMKNEAKIVYNSLINDQKLLPLSSFKSNKFSKYNLLPHATVLPDFFQHNLQNPSRIVKFLKGPEGYLRGFYYQLLKLAFQIENAEVDYATILKNIVFDPTLSTYSTGPSSGKQYNMNQYKRIIGQFIQHMQTQVIPNVELKLTQYPIIDEAMITILQLVVNKIIIQKGVRGEKFERKWGIGDILHELCQLFQIGLAVYQNCFSFEESDVFLYIESPQSCYLAYLSEMAEIIEHSKTSESPHDIELIQNLSNNSYGSGADKKKSAERYVDHRQYGLEQRHSQVHYGNKSAPGENSEKHKYGSKSVEELAKNYKKNFDLGYQKKKSNENQLYQWQSQQSVHKNVFEEQINEPIDKSKNMQDNNKKNSEQAKSTSFIVPTEQNKIVNQCEQKEKSSTKDEGINSSLASKNYLQSFSHKTLNGSTFDQKQKIEEVIADDKNQDIQMKKKDKRIELISMNSKPVQIPDTLQRKSSVKLDDKIFQYEFKSHKYRNYSILNSIVGATSPVVNNNPQPQKETKESKINVNINVNVKLPEKNDLKLGSKKQNSSFKQLLDSENPSQSRIIIKHNQNKITIEEEPGKKNYQHKQQYENNNSAIEYSYKYDQWQTPEKLEQKNEFMISIRERLGQSRYEESSKIINQFNNEQMNFFNPKSNPNSKLSGLSSEKQPNKQWKQPYNSKRDEDSLGTFYRQFSDTKVMEAMIQPFKTKVKTTRQKFKGIRSKNFKGFI